MPPPLGPEVGIAPPQAVELEFVYTSTEAVRSTVAVTSEFQGRSRFIRWLGAGLLLMAFSAIAMIPDGWRGAWFPAAFGAFFLLWPVLIPRWIARRDFRRQPSANETIHWRIDRDTLVTRGPNGVDTLTWGNLSKVTETKQGFLLFLGLSLAHWLPRHAFKSSADLDRVRTWIAENHDKFGRTQNQPTGPQSPISHVAASSTSVPSIEGSYLFTTEEAERARRALLKAAGAWRRVVPWTIPALVFCYVAGMSIRDGDWTIALILAVIMPGTFWFTFRKIRKARAEAFKRSPDANGEIRVTLSGDQIELRGSSAASSFRWKNVIKARESADGFLLYTQPRLAQWLPSRAFARATDVEQVRAWIRQHGINFKRL